MASPHQRLAQSLGTLSLLVAWAACSGPVDGGGRGGPGAGGSAGVGGSSHAEASAPGTGGTSSGSGGDRGQGGAGADGEDSSTPGEDDAGLEPDDAGGLGPMEAGQSGDGGWVGPEVPADCPGNPLEGWTEYQDTYHIEYPYDLMPSDRSSFENGIYTFWIFPNDKPHAKGNTTAPRIEWHWTNFTTGQKMWTGDVMAESPGTPMVVFQVHTTASGAGPVYLRIDHGDLEEINGSVLAQGLYGKWFNLKVAFTAPQSDATIWINNCQKLTLKNSRPGSGNFYFKNGVYTCEASICRDHFKNIHLYKR